MKILLIVVVVLGVLYFVTKSKTTTPQPTSLAGIWQSLKTTIGI